MDERPTHFYKYRSLAGRNAEYVERTICHDELHFPAPASFNDPFDCRPIFSFDASENEMASYYQSLVQKYKPNLTREQRRQGEREKLNVWKKNSQSFRDIQESHTEKITKEIGVLCLSEVNSDILMWSHYSDSHRGICLEFDRRFEFFAKAQKINYPPIRPRINPFRQSSIEMLEAAVLTKSEHWDYEREWRLVRYKAGPGTSTFPTEALTGIYLGAQVSDTDAEKIIGWIQDRKSPIKLYKASPSNTAFSLDLNEVPIANFRN